MKKEIRENNIEATNTPAGATAARELTDSKLGKAAGGTKIKILGDLPLSETSPNGENKYKPTYPGK